MIVFRKSIPANITKQLTLTQPLLVADGSVALPSIARSAAATTGIWFDSNNALRVAFGAAAPFRVANNGDIVGTGSLSIGASSIDATIARTAAGSFTLGGATTGQLLGAKILTELTTIAAAPTTTTTIQIPQWAYVFAVSVRVVTVIPTAATFTVTSGSPANTWNTAAVSTAANSTDIGTNGGMDLQTAAAGIVITPNLTPGAATGQVRVTIHYLDITAPTS